MHGDLSGAETDALLQRRRYGRLSFILGGDPYVIPINYAYDGLRLYGQAPEGTPGRIPGGTKLRAMRQNPRVAFQVDEITDPAHWRSVLLHGQFHELHDREAKKAAFARILVRAGGGERSVVSWAIDPDHRVVFTIEITQRHGRFEQREAYELAPLAKGPLPPVSRHS